MRRGAWGQGSGVVLVVLIAVLGPGTCGDRGALSWRVVRDAGQADNLPVVVKRQADNNWLSPSRKFDDGLGTCSRVGDVCGSDGRTYMSECDLAFASQTYELAVVVLHTGRCSDKDFRRAELPGPTTPALRHLSTLKKLSSLRWAPHHSLVQVAERPPPPHLRLAPTRLHPDASSDPNYRRLLERGPVSNRFNYCWNTKFRTIGECSSNIECLTPAPEYNHQPSLAQTPLSKAKDPHKYSYRVVHDIASRASAQQKPFDHFQTLNSYPNPSTSRGTASGYHVAPREGSISHLDDSVTQLPKYLPTGCAYVYKDSLYIGECCLPADPRVLNATAQKNVKNISSSKRSYASLNSVSEDSRLWGAAAAKFESDTSLAPEIVLYAADERDGTLDKSHVMSRPVYDERFDKDILQSNPSRDVGQTGSEGEFRGSWEYLKDWPPPIPTHPPSLTDKPWWVSQPTLPPQRTTEPPGSWDPWGTTTTSPPPPTAPTTTPNPWWPPVTIAPARPTSPWWLPPSQPFPWWTPGHLPGTTSTTTTTTPAPTTASSFSPVNRGSFQAACSPAYSSSFRTQNPGFRQLDNSVPGTLESHKNDDALMGINRIKYHGYSSSNPSYRKIWTNGFGGEHPHGVFGRRMMYDVSDPKIMYPSNTYYDRSNVKNRVTGDFTPSVEGEAQASQQEFNENDFKVVGGRPSSPHSYPWLAALFNGPKQFCGGSLIDSTHVLTAAHCVATLSSVDLARLRIVLGAHNIRSPEATAQTFTAKKVVRHKDYDPVRLMNDIAVITLNKPAELTQFVHPICLNSNPNSLVQEVGTVAGWGSLFEGGPQQGTLWEVQLVIWDNNSCRAKYGPAAPGGIVPSYLCAGRGGKDSCSGDSGGPIIKRVDGVWTQVGLVSWGIGCGKGQYPGVYSRMTHFLPWITEVIKKF